MRSRLDRHLFLESFSVFLLGTLIFSSLVILSSTVPRLEYIIGVPLKDLGYWLLLQYPDALVLSLPIAVLLAVLFTYGRLYAQHELIAINAGTVSPARAMLPFILVALLAVAIGLALREYIAPKTNTQVPTLWWQLTSEDNVTGIQYLVKKNLPLGEYELNFERANDQTNELFDVRLTSWDNRTFSVIFAKRAIFEDKDVRLFEPQIISLDLAANFVPSDENSAEDLLRDLLIRADGEPVSGRVITIKSSKTIEEYIAEFNKEATFADSRSIRRVYQEVQEATPYSADWRESLVLLHKKLAEPLAALALLILAIPLALMVGKSRSAGLSIALLVMLLWYLSFSLGQLLAQDELVPIWVGLWTPNIIFACAGIVLLIWREVRT